jgi:hypothetical protein
MRDRNWESGVERSERLQEIRSSGSTDPEAACSGSAFIETILSPATSLTFD